LLLVAFLFVNALNCHLSLLLASVVQDDAVNCNTTLLIITFSYFLPSLHSVCIRWRMSGYGSAGKFYFLSLGLFVKQLEPWIECVFGGNHEVHRANKAL